jgi:Major Facilitator Superfamily
LQRRRLNEWFSEGAPAALAAAALYGLQAGDRTETLTACTVASERYTISRFALPPRRAELSPRWRIQRPETVFWEVRMPVATRESLVLSARLQRLPTARYTWAFVLLLSGAFIVEAFDIGSLSVILPILKPLMHLSTVQVGMLAASSTVGITIGMIPAGVLADRFGRKRVLIGAMLWFSGLTLVSALAPDFRTLLMLRGLSGLGMGPASIMPYALLVELVSRTRGAFAGVLESALRIGYVAVPILGLVVLPSFAPDIAWRVFLLIAGLPIAYVSTPA